MRCYCTVGHMGQGFLESAIARMNFTNKPGKGIDISPDFLDRAEDLGKRLRRQRCDLQRRTEIFRALQSGCGAAAEHCHRRDRTGRRRDNPTACDKGFPKPQELFHDLAPGEALVPPGYAKKQRFTIDIMTRKVEPSQ